MSEDSTPVVTEAADHYALELDGARIGLAQFVDIETDAGPERVFVHTEVLPEHGGKGYAGLLVRAALDEVRASGRRFVAVCPYVRGFVEKNHDWDEVQDERSRAVYEAIDDPELLHP